MSSTSGVGVTSMVILLSLLFVFIAERVYPANVEWNARPLSDGARGWRQLARDLIYLLGVTQVTALLIRMTGSHIGSVLDAIGFGFGSAGALWPSHAPFVIRVVLAFFAMELLSYWIHRAAHRFKPLWQFHSTHHVITELNGLKSLRTHPVDNLCFYVGRTAPLMLVGAGLDEVVAATYFGAILGVLAHANIRVAEGYLGWIINLPGVHAVHHSADVAESKSNFGCHTVIWDRLFGTFKGSAKKALEIGVRPVGPRSLWQELAWPFYRSVSSLTYR